MTQHPNAEELTHEQINQMARNALAPELNTINDRWIRIFTSRAILAAPGRYWIRPSGNAPGHHPDDEHGDWGNLIHVKRGIVVGRILLETRDYDVVYSDILTSGLTIHDLGKYNVDGKSASTVPNHPMLVREVLKDIEPCPLIAHILGIAETHMGKWGSAKPDDHLETLGHLADYIASRTTVHIPVELPF